MFSPRFLWAFALFLFILCRSGMGTKPGNATTLLTPADSAVGRLDQSDPSGEAAKLTLPDSGLTQSDSLSELTPAKPPWWRVVLLPIGMTVLVGGVLWLLFTQRGN